MRGIAAGPGLQPLPKDYGLSESGIDGAPLCVAADTFHLANRMPLSHRLTAEILLVTITFIWGATFIIVKEALNDASPLSRSKIDTGGSVVIFHSRKRKGDLKGSATSNRAGFLPISWIFFSNLGAGVYHTCQVRVHYRVQCYPRSPYRDVQRITFGPAWFRRGLSGPWRNLFARLALRPPCHESRRRPDLVGSYRIRRLHRAGGRLYASILNHPPGAHAYSDCRRARNAGTAT